MFQRILLPTDGSEASSIAAEAAVSLADQFDAELHVIHVLEHDETSTDNVDSPTRYGEEAVQAAVELATSSGVEATRAVIEKRKSIHQEILTYTDEHSIDCIVMGTRGRSGLNRLLLGSVAEQTLRESPVPVMTVHEETVIDPDIGSILVPTDGSECAHTAVDHAGELARSVDATLHVIYVVETGQVINGNRVRKLREALEEIGEKALDLALDQVQSSTYLPTETSIVNGPPYIEIVRYAEEHDVDCIVMGTHGRKGIRRFLLGSVTERVIRRADVPVISVK
ncbi:Nucleotide-binding universal stress protein, UspA family [Halogranum amylolyticum]|uniref:Nucleotide-binding universal stress protein, UspA family n=1 Tax=Halogranum amylolyticum TaxID=660520 RepID=A0A1H8VTJ7_9EURY|nr:universal stress protein [Halogranum amylolyticum]SEP18654.1 Nucleotide-binding universal stress protein, UspA family [Halogranum amylolyticum]